MEYRRKISREEAEEGYILITKDALKMFPPIDRKFYLVENKKETPVKVRAISCICMGPEEPHQHYHLHYKPLKKGEVIVIRSGEKSKYTIKREKPT
ncbi:MAG: hypothetical protein QW404_01515 [Candidatus Nanoarchaeia archaeon]